MALAIQPLFFHFLFPLRKSASQFFLKGIILKIILREKVDNIGKKGEIVEVASGYARNFLLPKNLALKATSSNVKQWEERKRVAQQKKERGKLKALKVAEKLKKVRLILQRDMGEEGKLFGVVTSQDIVQEIKKKLNLEIDHRKVNLTEPIRVIGIKKVPLKLHPEVEISLEVEVKKKE
ncbi:50S ribosomal protein L9 [Candidatus Aerophobetes bacterium]|uniref:Large ribosomal subunit protein bL9 n=1 Tax=Aerophobetes bacterium TaxID=2030807 RepID=A0A523S4A1_UNCAE|nr:MAG: 50S ribosomal protein L9 [Candidatus Aerophobetes bacterium]